MNRVAYAQERRKTLRKHVTFPAWVEDAHCQRLTCDVVDMTLAGARLRVPDAALPSEFTLLLDAKSSLKKRCKVIWRDGFIVGIKFV